MARFGAADLCGPPAPDCVRAALPLAARRCPMPGPAPAPLTPLAGGDSGAAAYEGFEKRPVTLACRTTSSPLYG